MNFFESQDTARRNTSKLIALFALAVLALIGITNLLVMVILQFAATGGTSMALVTPMTFDWEQFFLVSAAVAAVVLFGSLYRIASLRGGGARVAEMMDGRLLLNSTEDPDERRVLNVVEEMALASGTPVPPVYLMEEEGINAFAAGYAPGDAVIGITRGAIQSLSRDQLQGVIAHEFSHILHGDMRINIRLIGVLYGILILGIIGEILMRSGARHRLGYSAGRSRSKDTAATVFLGLGLIAIGYVGTFFGNLIKAAVSRQREYLADASAVQYTRNPDGIAEALMKIATHGRRSYLEHPESSEISHALFEEGHRSYFGALYATHPPLEERIQAILPRWDGRFGRVLEAPAASPEPAAAESGQDSPKQGLRDAVLGTVIAGGVLGAGVQAVGGQGIATAVGNTDQKKVDQAQDLLQRMPVSLLDAAREPAGARAVLYLLLLSEETAVREAQLQLVSESADKGVPEELQRLRQSNVTVIPDQRLPLISIALASLRQLSRPQYERLRTNIDALIKLDGKVNLFEWSLWKIVTHHLDPVFGLSKTAGLGREDLKAKSAEISLVLTAIAYSNKQDASPRAVFARGADALNGQRGLEMLTRDSLSLDRLNGALDSLNQLKPLQKPALLKACAAAIVADDRVVPIEAELLRAVAATLDCPMPPLETSGIGSAD